MKSSTVPHSPGQPNPYYNPMRELLSRSESIYELKNAIKAIAVANKGASPPEIVKKCVDAGLKEKFRDIWHMFSKTEKSKAVIAPNPPTNSLYGRIADNTPILDIGSGNCMKLRQSSGRLTVVASDPALDTELAKSLTVQSHVSTAAEVLPMYDSVLTSFNALPQLSVAELSQIDERDGLHIIPDHEYLLQNGLAQAVEVMEQNELVTKIRVETPTKVFLDRPLNRCGYQLKEGYKLAVTYQRVPIVVTLPRDLLDWIESRAAVLGNYQPKIDATPASESNMNWKDLGYKWDGVPLEFEFMDGKCYVTMRNGKTLVGKTDYRHHLCFHAEFLTNPAVLVLIRVLAIRDFIPPHTGDALRYFVEKHPLVVDGVRLYGPPPFEPDKRPVIGGNEYLVDGLITRNRELDFYVKRTWTVDLTPADVNQLIDNFAAKGVQVDVDSVRPGLAEYCLTRPDGKIVLKDNHRPRPDKKMHTSFDTVMYLLELPTLDELVVLYKQLPVLEGYRQYMI